MVQRRPKSLSAAAAALLATIVVASVCALAGTEARAQRWTPAPASAAHDRGAPCPEPGAKLGVANRATFVYRAQQPYDIELFARIKAHRRSDLPSQDRDLFMVRARGDEADRAGPVTNHLRDTSWLSGQLFQCNRIVALTGVRTDGAIPNEDVYNQAGNSRVWGIFPDWERPLWHLSYPEGPEWSDDFGTNVRRISARADGIRAREKRTGVVITGWRYRGPNAWQYGRLAKRAGLDGQVIQTQGECQMSPDRFRHRASRLLDQYRNAGVGKAKLAMQVSFADDPGSTPLPHDVSPARAARCTQAAYAAGVRTFLLWAYPRSVDRYFAVLPDHIRR